MAIFHVTGAYAPTADPVALPLPRASTSTRKSVTPKWVDWLLIAVIGAILALYGIGFSVEVGPSMNHLGLIYVTRWGTLPTQPGQVIRLAPAELPAWRKYVIGSMVKRFVGFTPDGRLMYEGDNQEWSRDNRDGLKPVSPDHVAGVVVAAWSPVRLVRHFTKAGRMRNDIEFRYPPASVQWNDEYFSLQKAGYVVVVAITGGSPPNSYWGKSLGWRGSFIEIDNDGLMTIVDPHDGSTYISGESLLAKRWEGDHRAVSARRASASVGGFILTDGLITVHTRTPPPPELLNDQFRQ